MLAAQTAIGTGRMIVREKIEPNDLIKMVVSKKGTTAAGLKVLRNCEIKSIIRKAVEAAAKRSSEINERNERN